MNGVTTKAPSAFAPSAARRFLLEKIRPEALEQHEQDLRLPLPGFSRKRLRPEAELRGVVAREPVLVDRVSGQIDRIRMNARIEGCGVGGRREETIAVEIQIRDPVEQHQGRASGRFRAQTHTQIAAGRAAPGEGQQSRRSGEHKSDEQRAWPRNFGAQGTRPLRLPNAQPAQGQDRGEQRSE